MVFRERIRNSDSLFMVSIFLIRKKLGFFSHFQFLFYTSVVLLSPSQQNLNQVFKMYSASPFTCSKSTIKTPEEVVKYFQSEQWRPQNDVIDVVVKSLLITLNTFHTFFYHFHCCFWAGKYLLCRLDDFNPIQNEGNATPPPPLPPYQFVTCNFYKRRN